LSDSIPAEGAHNRKTARKGKRVIFSLGEIGLMIYAKMLCKPPASRGGHRSLKLFE